MVAGERQGRAFALCLGFRENLPDQGELPAAMNPRHLDPLPEPWHWQGVGRDGGRLGGVTFDFHFKTVCVCVKWVCVIYLQKFG